MMLKLVAALLVWITAAGQQTVGSAPDRVAPTAREPGVYEENGQVEVVLGYGARQLPFRLNLDSSRPPRSLRELVDKISEGLPEDRLRLFAAYYGGREFATFRMRYDSNIAFWRDLYLIEILAEANRVWRLGADGSPLRRSIDCVGRSFDSQVAIQIGHLYLESHEADESGETPRKPGFRNAYLISRRLFEICDRNAGHSIPVSDR